MQKEQQFFNVIGLVDRLGRELDKPGHSLKPGLPQELSTYTLMSGLFRRKRPFFRKCYPLLFYNHLPTPESTGYILVESGATHNGNYYEKLSLRIQNLQLRSGYLPSARIDILVEFEDAQLNKSGNPPSVERRDSTRFLGINAADDFRQKVPDAWFYRNAGLLKSNEP